MPFTLLGLLLGAAFFIFGIKRKQRIFKFIGGLLFALVLIYWIAILIR